MKIGWIISVQDLVAKDQAFRMSVGSREVASAKAKTLKEKYDGIEKDRFKVTILSPYIETDETAMRILSIKSEPTQKEELKKRINSVDGLFLKEADDTLVFAVLVNSYERISTELEKFAPSMSELAK